MKKFVYRMLAGVVASLARAFPCAAELAVVGCLFDPTNPQITDDPNQCPPERKLDIVSIKTSWTQTLAVGGGGGGGAGKVQVGPFVVSKNLDRTSPGLFLDVVTGRHLRGVLIAVFESNSRGNLRRGFRFPLPDARRCAVARGVPHSPPPGAGSRCAV